MAVQCPYCGFEMKLGNARPGKFAPRCKQCSEKFLLLIPDDPNKPPVVAARKKKETEDLSASVAAALGIEVPRKRSSQRKPGDSLSGSSMMGAIGPGDSLSAAQVVAAAPQVTAPPPASPRQQESRPPVMRDVSSADMTAMPSPVTRTGSLDDSSTGSGSAGVTSMPGAPERSAYNVASAVGATSVPGARSAGVTSAPGAFQSQQPGQATQTTEARSTTKYPGRDKRLGGYELLDKLGQGGMGSVYLARQISLDRDVAVKVLSPQLAADPSFVARFTREAYAAAQLSHHNIVQIHDIGEDNNTHYFSMEFVKGQPLSGAIKKSGKMASEAAAGYILQAARGLKFAHDHAMIHRDIKPENLLLNDQGMLKVADLGLVKRRGVSDETASPMLAQAQDASMTGAGASMGTPAYMAPEQAKDATQVDVRADIYSLGCTMYDLLTGRPPFIGKTALEVITKHATEPMIPPDMIVHDVPKSLSAILMKMVAKRPQDRYSSMDEVITALEGFLGLGGPAAAGEKKEFSPGEQNARSLELTVQQFNGSMWAGLRGYITATLFVVDILLAFASLWFFGSDGIQWAAGFLGLGLLSFLSYIVLSGVTEHTHLFRKLRQYVFGAKAVDWVYGIAFTLVFVGILFLFMHWLLILFLCVGFGVAAGYHFSVDRMARKQRELSLTQTEGLLRQMRLRGMDEDSLREFVCKYSGDNWEEFYETLFGYDAKIQARQRWGTVGGKNRKKWGTWREPIIAWIDVRMKQRKEDRERAYLARVEEKKLRYQGVDSKKAKADSEKVADTLVDKANRYQKIIESGKPMSVKQAAAFNPGALVTITSETPEDQEFKRERLSYLQRKYGSIWGLMLGSQVRLLVGLALVAGFVARTQIENPNWISNIFQTAKQKIDESHNKLSGEDRYQTDKPSAPDLTLKAPTQDLSQIVDSTAVGKLAADQAGQRGVSQDMQDRVLGFLGSGRTAWGGALLLISAMFRGAKMGFSMLISVGTILIVPHYVQNVLPTRGDTVCFYGGTLLAGLSYMFARA